MSRSVSPGFHRLLARVLAPTASLRRVLAMLWQSSPRWTVASTVLVLAEVGFGLAALYLLKQLFDVLTTALDAGGDTDLRRALFYVALTGATTLAHLGAKSLAALAAEAQGERIAEHVDTLIHAKAVAVDLAFYESPLYFDTLQRARRAGPTRPAGVANNLFSLARNGLTLAAVGGLMISLHWLLLPVLLVGVIPGLLVRLYFTRLAYDWQRRRTQIQRRLGYIDWLLTSDDHAKELRLNQLGDYLRSRYQSLRRLLRQEQLTISRQRTVVEVVTAAVGTVAFFLSLAYLAWQASLGQISAGDLVLFLLIFQRVQGTAQSLLGNISKLYEDHLYISQLFEFLDVQPLLSDPAHPLAVPRPMAQGVALHHVTFQYPDAPEVALRDISLTIAPGQVVALVGANGSGKTTLIKLLCRLYDPTAGHISLDGIDVRQFRADDYRRVFSVIFQDYAHYSLSARDNIRFGAIDLEEDDPAIVQAAITAGADGFIRRLRHGYETQLSRAFDEGAEISIGQWQKIALARAFLHQSQVVVLDEPTSALDADAEFELFQDFRRRIGYRAAVVISHRLSTVRQADYIYVLDRGRIVEQGTHDQLMQRAGIYQRMFDRQGFYYRNSVSPGPAA